mgnify:CR=1 FL=1
MNCSLLDVSGAVSSNLCSDSDTPSAACSLLSRKELVPCALLFHPFWGFLCLLGLLGPPTLLTQAVSPTALLSHLHPVRVVTTTGVLIPSTSSGCFVACDVVRLQQSNNT